MGLKENRRSSVFSKYKHYLQPSNSPLWSFWKGIDRRWILFLVTILHGTFSPSVRILFDLPHAPDSAIFNTLRLLLSSSLYLPILMHSLQAEQVGNVVVPNKLFSNPRHSWLFGGIELGIWVFLGNISQVIGLETTSASRAAFLVQLQTIFVPILSSWLGQVSSFSERIASIVSIIGVAILSSRKSYSTPNRTSLFGDGLEILAAAFFSVYVIRLGYYARRYSPVSLASVKVITQAVLSMFWLLWWEVIQSHAGNEWFMNLCKSLQVFFQSDDKWIFVAVIVWTGVIVSGASTLLQTIGQERVASSDAAIIYATQPLWACMFSFFLLHESFQTSDWLGGLLILTGTLLSAKKPLG